MALSRVSGDQPVIAWCPVSREREPETEPAASSADAPPEQPADVCGLADVLGDVVDHAHQPYPTGAGRVPALVDDPSEIARRQRADVCQGRIVHRLVVPG